ncbi:MAG: hypothetical protein LQ344_006813 [Seirophora lacunosa]|nr:MAG: hypothetical protein LQ344_006813 [Seirophora lacunosa]
MQNPDSFDSSVDSAGRSHISMPNTFNANTVDTGFSHGAYKSNQRSIGGFAHRHRRPANISSINTSSFGTNTNQGMNDMAGPATGYDMNFTPLLPSQLLLGSPFQPGSPSSFASPRFSGFGGFQQQNSHQQNSYQQQSQTQMHSPIQSQHAGMSPNMYQSMISPANYGLSSYMTGPQSPTGSFATFGNQAFGGAGAHMQMGSSVVNSSSRTVYLGNIPPETSAEEILSHVRSGPIESVRLLPDKNCAFISFLESSSATHFHSDAILKKLSIRGQDIKIGWGKPAQVPTSVSIAVQQSGASRNVYLGNLPETVTEAELREDLGKFGPIDTVKIVREKAIGFVHFLSIGNAIKAVAQLPQELKWQAPRRVYYGKDRCAYISKTQQQNAAQFLGIPPGLQNTVNAHERELISNTLAQQSAQAAAVATSAGGINNLGNRTVYLGNIHPETTIEEICNVVRGGLLHHIRYIPDKHICFVTFIDPTAAASFYALSNMQGLMIHNRRLKIGWGKHSGALPPAIALAVTGGASRNVYIGNLDESWTEERLRLDFSEYGEIELVNALREKSCAFVNFTNIANAIKAIEAIRGKEDYGRFKVNFGKDRCGNPPRQNNHNNQHSHQPHAGLHPRDGMISQSPMNGLHPSISHAGSSVSPTRKGFSPAPGSTNSSLPNGIHAPTPSTILNAGQNNPLTMFLNHVSAQQVQQEQDNQTFDTFSVAQLQQQQQQHQNQHQQQMLANQQSTLYGNDPLSGSILDTPQQQQQSHMNGLSTTSTTVGGMLALANARSQHSRAISLPGYSELLGNGQTPQQQNTSQSHSHRHQQSSFSGFGGFANIPWALNGWAEEEVPNGH